ncbi:MAG TPA: hypothetical protein VJ481_01420, partial [Patescibacteria group bacterium]|nr:hypothetical protein [Patescibacteria group bacterium]
NSESAIEDGGATSTGGRGGAISAVGCTGAGDSVGGATSKFLNEVTGPVVIGSVGFWSGII